MRRFFTFCAVIYVLIYAFEGPVRYALHLAGADLAIFARDGLMLLPLLALLTAQAFRLRVHPAYWVFAAVVAVHGAIIYLNMHDATVVVYGAKLLVNTIFGFIAASQLVRPGRGVARLFCVVWLVSIAGLLLDKFFIEFPWAGLTTTIDGLSVDISRGWDITGMDKRAAGFTRSSIAAAMILPVLALVIVPRIRSYAARALILLVTVGAVFLTTQKGSLLAFAIVMPVFLLPRLWRFPLLVGLCVAFAVADIAVPLLASGVRLPENGGVFSLSSFAMRMSDTWPEAWRWIADNGVFPLGVGLGGIGGAQRLYALDFFNPSDNLFVFLYGNFGLMSLIYLGWPVLQALRVPAPMRQEAIVPLGVLTFLLGYGVVLSLLEDPLASLFVGAAAGMLWQMRQLYLGRPWADPYTGKAGYEPVRVADPHAPALPRHAMEAP